MNCGVRFGEYHCQVCNLWMSAKDEPYHCEKCGFCRVGGRENFRHCDDCGMCIDAFLFEDHNCSKCPHYACLSCKLLSNSNRKLAESGKYMSNCPVCQEDLFSSRLASHEMPCGGSNSPILYIAISQCSHAAHFSGHAIHWHCFKQLTTHDTRCPGTT